MKFLMTLVSLAFMKYLNAAGGLKQKIRKIPEILAEIRRRSRRNRSLRKKRTN